MAGAKQLAGKMLRPGCCCNTIEAWVPGELRGRVKHKQTRHEQGRQGLRRQAEQEIKLGAHEGKHKDNG